ncbi:MAG: AraC family transcriptional regulator, partial [Polaribacter sp.]
MKITGDTDEFIELTELNSDSCSIFKNLESSSLTILWFQTDNEFIVDGKNYSFIKNQIVFFTEFHNIE